MSALFGPGATLIKKLAHLRLQIPVKVAYVPRTLSTYVIKHILSSYLQHKAIFVVEDSSLEHVRFSLVKTGYYNVNVWTGSEFFFDDSVYGTRVPIDKSISMFTGKFFVLQDYAQKSWGSYRRLIDYIIGRLPMSSLLLIL